MLIKPFLGITDPNSTFPRADTCFFNLMLPEYTSATILRDKLLFAINNTDTMDADIPHPEARENGRRGANRFFNASAESSESDDSE